MKFATKVIHAGIRPDPSTGAIMTPIFQTSTYAQEAPGKHQGYAYARSKNPTRGALEENLAALEKGVRALCFGSGMAAISAVLQTLRPGDEIISTNDLYGGSYRIFTKVFAPMGIKTHFLPLQDTELLRQSINSRTRMIWVETPTNPMLNIIDIAAVAEVAKQKQLRLVVDNTFASPYLQNPLDLGADAVVHSGTKYLGGHSDVVHGAVVCKDEAFAEQLAFLQNAGGAIPGPQDCFLMLRGIKTLHLRVQRSCENAAQLADFLKKHPKVSRVYYPGLKEHPGHELAKRQMRDFGGMLSFDLKEDKAAAAVKVMQSTRYFTCAESLGGVESLIGHPVVMTHADLPKAERLKVGITDSLMRLSVGVEDVQDLMADLEGALAQL